MMMTGVENLGIDWQGKAKYEEENLPHCRFDNNTSHTTRPGLEPMPPQWEAGD
jgi:hypothetical protein